MTLVQKINEAILLFGPLYLFYETKKLNEHIKFWQAVAYCALALVLVNGLKFMLLANCMPVSDSNSFISVIMKNLMGLLDLVAIQFVLKKKWIEAGNRLSKIYATAFAWTVTAALFSNGLYIITSDSGEEIEYDRFFTCIAEFLKLLDNLAVCGLLITSKKESKNFVWILFLIRFALIPIIAELNIGPLSILSENKHLVSVATSIGFFILTKPFIKA